VLAEVGYADALLVRELDDGSLELVDGHLRAELTPEAEVPVLVLDLSAAEADKLLALLDPLSAMAETNFDALADLVAHVETENAAIQRMLDRLASPPDLTLDSAAGIELPEVYQLVVECRDEAEQRALFERLEADGFHCKPLNL
jgi:ParB-like chromosome segregation protein Spo0J